MPTDPLTGARYPAPGASPNIPQDIQNAVADLSDNTIPRFTSTTTRDSAYAAWVSAGNTMVAGLRCYTTDRNLEWIYTGTRWMLTGWAGEDKTKQPMISVSATAISLAQTATYSPVTNWPTVVDNSNGLFTIVSGAIRCAVAGRIRVEALALSDTGASGWSALSVTLPIGGGALLGRVEDYRQRNSGYANSGTLRQGVTNGPVVVAPGDLITYALSQSNNSATAVSYDALMNVSYV